MTDRRHVLQMGALATLALLAAPACSDDSSTTEQPPPTPDPQQSEELALIAAYDAALLTVGETRRVEYQRIRDEHAAHLRALGWDTEPTPAASPAPAPSRRQLRRDEASTARSHAEAAVNEPDAERAQLLALIAASESQHAATLAAL